MIMRRNPEFPEPSPDPGPRAALRSIERHLSKEQGVTDEVAHQAQQMVYDAWEAPTDEEELELMKQALKLDPANVDALLHIFSTLDLEEDEEIETLRKIVAVGEKKLGPKAFKEFAGAFWGFIETRPYMRARERLAEYLRAADRLEEAIVEWEAMLQLNPGDNQGVRYALLATLLALGRLDRVRKLFQAYSGEFDFNAVFAWGRVLERFLSGDLAGSSVALTAARKQNPHMQAYVKGHRTLPKYLAEAYAPGSKEEAICFAEGLRAAWGKHPAALKWLETQKTK
jgi:tetratricopeptide (TPR) repeat protein